MPVVYKLIGCFALIGILYSAGVSAQTFRDDAFSFYGPIKHSADFNDRPYANPNAPKGGVLRMSMGGRFDSFSPYNWIGFGKIKPPLYLINLSYEMLVEKEPGDDYSYYGLLAGKIEVSQDRSEMTVHIRPEAAFANGKSVLVEDVLYTIEVAIAMDEKYTGGAFLKPALSRIDRDNIQILSEKVFRVRINGKTEIERLDVIRQVLTLFIFPKDSFGVSGSINMLDVGMPKNTVDRLKFAGTGPYQIDSFTEDGKNITYKLNKNYWGRHLPQSKGKYNFDRIQLSQYSDSFMQYMGLVRGDLDLNYIHGWGRWEQAKVEAKKNKLRPVEIAADPMGQMLYLTFNQHRPVMQNQHVREALAMLYDFPKINENIFNGTLVSSTGLFPGRPFAGVQETPPVKMTPRERAREALWHFARAGWHWDGKKMALTNSKGETFPRLKVLYLYNGIEKMFLYYKGDLERFNIKLDLIAARTGGEYTQAIRDRDFDIGTYYFYNEFNPTPFSLRERFHSEYGANKTGDKTVPSESVMGLNDMSIDALVERVEKSENYIEKWENLRALDREVTNKKFSIPMGHVGSQWWLFGPKIEVKKAALKDYGTMGVIEFGWENR